MSTLNAEAISAIAELALRTQIPQPTGLRVPSFFVAKGDGVRLLDVEEYSAGRARFRGCMETTSIMDFCQYVASRGISTTRVFADIEAALAKAFFNIGTDNDPGHCDDTAILTLSPTPQYAAITGVAGVKFTQKGLAEWLEDWASEISPIGSPSLSAAITAIRSIEIKAGATYTHDDGDFGAQKTAMEQIEARAKSAELQLPSGFVFVASPYDCFAQRDFHLRLSVFTGDDKPKLGLRVVGLGKRQQQIGEEFSGLLATGIGMSASIHRGSFTP